AAWALRGRSRRAPPRGGAPGAHRGRSRAHAARAQSADDLPPRGVARIRGGSRGPGRGVPAPVRPPRSRVRRLRPRAHLGGGFAGGRGVPGSGDRDRARGEEPDGHRAHVPMADRPGTLLRGQRRAQPLSDESSWTSLTTWPARSPPWPAWAPWPSWSPTWPAWSL